jgi:hypothetical protein
VKLHRTSRRFFGALVFESVDVRLQFLGRGQAAEVELQHLPGPLGRLLAGPQTDEQAGDDAQVDLDGDAVAAGGQEMLATEDALEPTEEQLDGPAVAITQSDQFGVEVEAIGGQEQDDGLAVFVGGVDFDNP